VPRYVYVVFDKKANKKITDEAEAASPAKLRSDLQEKGLFVIRVEEKLAGQKKGSSFFQSVSTKDLVSFYKSLMLSVRAGVSLAQVFETLASQFTSKYFRQVLDDIYAGITKGRALSDCFRQHPKVFGEQFVAMIEAGEASGKLAEVLEDYCKFDEEARRLRGEVVGAMMYPAVILLIAITAVLILTLHIFPKFIKSVSIPMSKMPMITQVVYGFSTFVLSHWLAIGLTSGILFFGLSYLFTKVPKGVRFWHWFQLNVPMIGTLVVKVNLSQFARTMALQARSGVASIQALQLTHKSISNVYYQDMVADIIETIKRGGTYMDAMTKRPKLITPLVVLLISVGEQTGTFDEVLETIADYYAEEVRTTLKSVTSMIEPIMIVNMAIVVGSIAAAMFMPMFDMVDSSK